MADSRIFTPAQVPPSPPAAGGNPPPPQTIVIQTAPSFWGRWSTRLLLVALSLSVIFNVSLFATYREYFANVEPPLERFHSGNKLAKDKIALL